VDLVALSDKSQRLLNTAILFYGFFGLWLLWSDLFPALRILDEVTLWHHTVTVDGEAQILPVTLASVGLALFYAAGAVGDLAAAALPDDRRRPLYGDHLDHLCRGRGGLLLVLSTLGARWSQVQWLAAALSVGIGFGLQEIVANFISG
jgi:potassium efflux system protein